MRGDGADVVSAWKEVLLARRARARRPRARPAAVRRRRDRLARGRVRRVRRPLRGAAAELARRRRDAQGRRCSACATTSSRSPRTSSAAGSTLTRRELRRLRATILATAAAVAAFGLVDVYAIPLSWWRDSGAPGWFTDQLGLRVPGPLGAAGELRLQHGNERPLRRLVSTFLSPLATSYLLVVALLVCAAWFARDRPRGRTLALWVAIGRAALRRAALDALALVVPRARARARRFRVACAAARRAQRLACRRRGGRGARGRRRVREGVPAHRAATRFTPRELAYQRAHAAGRRAGGQHGRAEDASTRSHWRSLRTAIAHGRPPPAGLRPRQRRLDRGAHGGRRSRPASRPTPSSASRRGSLGALVFVAWSLGAAVARRGARRCVDRRVARRGARARAADRRDRRAVARLRALGARRLARAAARER